MNFPPAVLANAVSHRHHVTFEHVTFEQGVFHS